MDSIILYLLAYIMLLYNAYLREIADRLKKDNDILKKSLGESYYWILSRQNRIKLEHPELWTPNFRGFINTFITMWKVIGKKIIWFKIK